MYYLVYLLYTIVARLSDIIYIAICSLLIFSRCVGSQLHKNITFLKFLMQQSIEDQGQLTACCPVNHFQIGLMCGQHIEYPQSLLAVYTGITATVSSYSHSSGYWVDTDAKQWPRIPPITEIEPAPRFVVRIQSSLQLLATSQRRIYCTWK